MLGNFLTTWGFAKSFSLQLFSGVTFMIIYRYLMRFNNDNLSLFSFIYQQFDKKRNLNEKVETKYR